MHQNEGKMHQNEGKMHQNEGKMDQNKIKISKKGNHQKSEKPAKFSSYFSMWPICRKCEESTPPNEKIRDGLTSVVTVNSCKLWSRNGWLKSLLLKKKQVFGSKECCWRARESIEAYERALASGFTCRRFQLLTHPSTKSLLNRKKTDRIHCK